MVLGTLSTIAAAGVVGYTYMVQGGASPPPSKSDAKKIQRICANKGLVVKESKATRTMQQLTRRNIDGGKEYIFRIPLGLSFDDFNKEISALRDGLNNRKTRESITMKDLLSIRSFKDVIGLYKREAKWVNKDVEMSYDGCLRIRVYDQPLPDKFIYDDNTISFCKGWEIPIGHNRSGMLTHDFEKEPHMLVAGATGKGKSVYLKSLITTLISNKPEDVSFSLLDLKGGLSFARYAKCNQSRCLAKNLVESHAALELIIQQMEDKMAFLLSNGYEDISEMGDTKRHFIIVDEAAELSSSGETDSEIKKLKVACESMISDIARRGRACGFRLVYATQYPTNETIKSQVRQNIGARVCFYLSTAIASRVVLDETGAEELPEIKGRAIYKKDKCVTLQTPFITNSFIEEKLEPHIRIRSREGHHAKVIEQTEQRRTNTLVIEETWLSES